MYSALKPGTRKTFFDELEAALLLWLYLVTELENAPENGLGEAFIKDDVVRNQSRSVGRTNCLEGSYR